MTLSDLYAAEAREFNKRVTSLAIEANRIMEKFPYDFNDVIIRDVVAALLEKNNVHSHTELSNYQKRRILNEKTLLDGILSWHLDVLQEQLVRQYNWIKSNDYPSSPEKILLRTNFVTDLLDIVNEGDFTMNGTVSLRQNLIVSMKISDKITHTDFNSLKDISTFGILDVCSALLKLCGMIIAYPLYYDSVVDNKCRNASPFSSIWSGKTLNDMHFEHLEAKVRRIESAYNAVCECLLMIDGQCYDKHTNDSPRL